MQHYGAVALTVLADIAGVEPLRQNEIHLQRAALPVTADRVAQHELQLRSVKSTFTGVDRIRQSRRLRGLPERPLRLVPGLIGARAHRRPVGEFDSDVVETEILVDRAQQVAEFDALGIDLTRDGDKVTFEIRSAKGPVSSGVFVFDTSEG